MKKSRLGGGLLLGAIVLGVLIGQFFQFKGPGTGKETNSSGESEQVENPAPDPQSPEATSALVNSEASAKLPDASAGSEGQEPFITVVVFQDKYRLTRDDNPETGLEMPLAEIVKRAQATSGSPEGIRVRVLLHESAQGGAHSDLLEALHAAGLKSEAIQEKAGFLQ